MAHKARILTPGQIAQAVAILREGGLVAFPTDTVYGLGADAFNEGAVARLYRAKGRPPTEPLPLLVADMAQLSQVSRELPPAARLLAGRFLPGGLTLVLLRSPAVPPVVSAGGDTIGVRIPNHPVALALIGGLGRAVTGTSANLSGCPSPVTAAGVAEQLGDRIEAIIDGGRSPGGIASTVVDCTVYPPRILREGIVGRAEIEEALRREGYRLSEMS